MEICRKIRSTLLIFLLLFSALLANTSQGVHAETHDGEPLESQCRPYVEEALKKHGTKDTSVEPELPQDETDTAADLSKETLDGSIEVIDAAATEITEDAAQESIEKELSVEEQDKQKSEENVSQELVTDREESNLVSAEDEKSKEESSKEEVLDRICENETDCGSDILQSAEEHKEEEPATGEEVEEEKKSSEEPLASAEEKKDETDETEQKASSENVEEVAPETVQEEEIVPEKAASVEEGTQDEVTEEVTETNLEDDKASHETTEEEPIPEADTKQEEQETEEQKSSIEEEANIEQMQADASAEVAEAQEQQSVEQEHASEEAQAEASSEQKEEHASEEQAAESTEQEQAATSTEQEQPAASAEQEQAAESTEQEQQAESTEQDNAAASTEQEPEQESTQEHASTEDAEAKAEHAFTEQTESGEQKEASSVETNVEQTESVEQADGEEQKASVEASAEQVDAEGHKEESTEQTEEGQKDGSTEQTEEVQKEVAAEQTDAEVPAEVSAEEQATDSDKVEAGEEQLPAETQEGEPTITEQVNTTTELVPEEELMLDFNIPTNLRPRHHISQLMRLDDDSNDVDKVINKAADVVLRELKRLYENAIKPLETLYKYRDLSNRHFGDPEIFSKPLVLFMGPWSGGKSSIINYLLDNEYKHTSLRTGAEPSPAYFNILMWGEEPEMLDGTQLAADWTFSGLQKFGQGLEERLKGLKLPSKLLEKINIVEIPGILEVRKQVSRVFPFNDACQWFIDRADIIFLVYDPSKLDVGPETEAILDQLKGREYQTRIILNKADQVKSEELIRVQGALIWNLSPLMASAQPPVMYLTSLWSNPYEEGAPVRLLQAQERAFLRDIRTAIDKRIENKISSARRFAVRVRNHAKMVDCYLTTYYNHKSLFVNKKLVADQIIEHPQDYHIYEGLSTLTNISRYDLPDPDVYRDFFHLNPLYEFQQLSATCTYFRGCPINRLDVAIAYDFPELVGKYKKLIEAAVSSITNSTKS